jgi:hypothetical protein
VVFGFKYALDSVSAAPEALFFRKSFKTVEDGVLTVDGDYTIEPNKVNVAARWVSKKLGLDVNADVNSQSYLTKVDIAKSMNVDDKKVTVSGSYNLLKKQAAGGVDVKIDATNVGLAYDQADNDVTLTLSHELDADNVVFPSVSSSAKVGLGFLRRWQGGQLRAQYQYPADKLNLEWTDDGANGAWTTKAEVPIRNAKQTKVSLSRDWTY